MRYCAKCVLPDTRPNLVIGPDGVCNACRTHEEKPVIDWTAREKLFAQVAELARKRSRGHDCIIPVSGGKDSHWQVIKCLEYGLNPLCITWKTPARTRVGQANLDNLIQLGVDHIDFQINPKVERIFMLEALKRYGDPAIPMHMALFNIPLSMAVKLDIPLVVWGENSAFEYGGTDEEKTGFKLDAKWLQRFGVTHGTTAQDWISEELNQKALTPYRGPADEELESRGILAVFLGYYFTWDPEVTLKAASDHGFQARVEGPKTGYYNYADIDDDFISVHHYFKWLKFGFTRTYDNLSLEIRNNRLSRDQALEIIKNKGDETPNEDIDKMCAYLGISRSQFDGIAEKFRNQEVWIKQDGKWMIDDFIIEDWQWA